MRQTEVTRTPGAPFDARRRIGGQQTVLIGIVSLTILVVSSLIAADGSVAGWEESVLVFINDWPDWLEPPMWVLQQVGVIGTPVIVAVIVYFFTRRWQHFVAFAAILPLKLTIEKAVVKNLVERTRPFDSIGPQIKVRGPAFEGLSFPSGHTTTAFAVGVLLSAILPRKWRPVPVIWAGIVGLARLYYGEHNVLDIVAGAATGTLFAVVLWYLLLNRVVEDETVEAGVDR